VQVVRSVLFGLYDTANCLFFAHRTCFSHVVYTTR